MYGLSVTQESGRFRWLAIRCPTTSGIWIGPVYTPPAERNKGYATSLVARMSQQALDGGRKFCALFTDLSNPTSNAIYQRIGYRPICRYALYGFLAPGD